MSINKTAYQQIISELAPHNITLVAVSKIKPVSDILELYQLSQRDFGENYVQELVDKANQLPKDIRWHFIGHLQSNKAKYIAPFVHLIHGIDSLNLLKEVNKQAAKNGRVIDVLLQVHIADEESKFGFDESELNDTIEKVQALALNNIKIVGLMGMASFSDNESKVRSEFKKLKKLFSSNAFQSLPSRPSILSFGMSGDYKIAIEEGSTMVRIGSLLFGARL